jgi:hypothetical protein
MGKYLKWKYLNESSAAFSRRQNKENKVPCRKSKSKKEKYIFYNTKLSKQRRSYQ